MVEITDFYADKNVLSHDGGTITLTIETNKVPTYDEVDVPEIFVIAMSVSSFISQNGEFIFFSTEIQNTSSCGIWRYDIKTKKFIRVYSTGTHWHNWYEDNFGNIYVSATSSGTEVGLLKWNGTGFTKVISEYKNFTNFFQKKNGTLFCSTPSSTDGNGLFRKLLAAATFTKILTTDNNYTLGETSSGAVIYVNDVANVNRGNGIIESDTATVRKAFHTTTLSNVTYSLFCTKNGDVYFWDNAVNRNLIAYLKNGTYTMINITINNIRSLKNFIETGAGIVYCTSSSDVALEKGIFRLNGNSVLRIYSETGNWDKAFVLPNGPVYFSSSTATNTGIIRVVGDTATKIYNVGYDWMANCYYDTETRTLYCSSNVSTGILAIKGSVVTALPGITLNKWEYFRKDRKTQKLEVSRNATSGLFRYDEEEETFVNIKNNYCGRTFGLFTAFLDNATATTLWHKKNPVITLSEKYGTLVHTTDKIGIAFAPDKATMLVASTA